MVAAYTFFVLLPSLFSFLRSFLQQLFFFFTRHFLRKVCPFWLAFLYFILFWIFPSSFNPLKPELNSICYLLALLAHHFLHVSRIRIKSITFRRLMSYIYIYMEHPFLMFLDHTQRRSTVGRTPLDE